MEAIRTIGKFLSSDHQTELTYTTYLPQSGEPSAILQVSHGMCEYFERYRPLAEYFCAELRFADTTILGMEQRRRRMERSAFLQKRTAGGLFLRMCIALLCV